METDNDSRLPVPQGSGVPKSAGGDLAEAIWRAGPPLDPGGPQGAGLSAFRHAFRRRWLAAILLGVAIAVPGMLLVWSVYRPQYEALAAFRIAARQESILPKGGDRTATAFDIYKSTQQQLVASRFVLIAALRNPEVAQSALLKGKADPAGWLAENLQVGFPGNAEIMHISLEADNPQEAAQVVNAVADAYTTEIIDAESSQRRQRLDELDRIRSEKEAELRAKRGELKELVRRYGSGDRDALNLQQQIALQQYAALRGELSATKFKTLRMKWELASKKAAAERSASAEVTDAEVDDALRTDPAAASLLRQSMEVVNRREQARGVLTPGREAEYVERYDEWLKQYDAAIAARREGLREELRGGKAATLQAEIQQLEQEIAVSAEQEKQLLAEAGAAETEAKSFGTTSIDVEMMREEISLLQQVMRTVADERERLLIEMRSRPRISLFHKAELPSTPASDRRLQFTALAGLAGFFFPFAGIIWLDLRTRRVGCSGDVAPTTGLHVIGAVPRLPGDVRRWAMVAPARHRRLRQELNASVDSIAARMLYLAQRDRTHVVLVTSAECGEGKTTLATQLALSLARTAHRVLLLDFDLRRPAVGGVFDIPLEPGLAGVLRHEAEVHEAIRKTEVEHCWVLPAGRADQRLLASLANGAVGSLFAQLREEFDYVIVDGSPLLPVPDARFLCRHVDGVVLSVLRDVSNVPSILAACDVLSDFDVRPIGVVVTGVPRSQRYDSTKYALSE